MARWELKPNRAIAPPDTYIGMAGVSEVAHHPGLLADLAILTDSHYMHRQQILDTSTKYADNWYCTVSLLLHAFCRHEIGATVALPL